MSVAVIFELDTPFTADELPFLGHEQSADVFIITSLGDPITRLRRFSHNNWILDDAPLGTQMAAPATASATANMPVTTDAVVISKFYAVSAVSAAGQESLAFSGFGADNDLTLRGNNNVITWAAVPGAAEYRIYEERSGVFGYLGTALAGFLTFKDDNIQANFGDAPPKGNNPFADGNYPAVVTFHESRAWFGRTLTMPNALFAGQTDDLFNFDRSTPVRATDSIAFRLRARRLNTIRHLVPMKDLTVMTSDMIFSIRSTGDGYLSPTTSKSVPEGHRGVGSARPELVGDVAFYSSVAENSIHTLGYTFEKDGYRGNDITVFASHFFALNTVQALAWTDAPASVLWVRRDDGKLPALTWMQEQDVWGWTLCETDGVVESICSVAEERRDVLYAVIRRQINGEQRRYVEYLAEAPWTRQGWNDLAGAVVLDSSVYLEFDEPVNSIKRCFWLEGREVVCLADGVVRRGHMIIDGELIPPLPDPVSRLVVGLPYQSRIRTLPISGQAQGLGSMEGRRQSIANVTIKVMNTCGMGDGLKVGANLKDGETVKFSAPLPVGVVTQTPPLPFSGYLETDGVEPGDGTDAVVEIIQDDPLPMVILSISTDADMGR